MKGDNTPNQPANYGTKGVPNAANKPHGAYESAQWADKHGNLWLFCGGNGFYNTLWRYEPTTNNWTWMNGDTLPIQHGIYGTKGVASALNSPGGRMAGIATWTDTTGYLWLFGGLGMDEASLMASNLNDLWRYDPNPLSPTFNQWTWMSGTKIIDQKGHYGTKGIPGINNYPGGRMKTSCTWVDKGGDLWLFGGTGKDSVNNGQFTPMGYLNDLWRYNISTNTWTWENGDPLINQNGIYLTMGTSNPNCKPGGRVIYTSWTDINGNFWLYGGTGLDGVSGTPADLNDMWKYDMDPLSPAFNEWTWVSGSSTISGQAPISYGAKCVSSVNNNPGTRSNTRARWTDVCGNFWMFSGNSGLTNDLWKYKPGSGIWTWVSGDNTSNTPGVYGIQGVSSPLNKPCAKNGSVGWITNSGFWIFGGQNNALSFTDEMNDLWKYVPDSVSANFTSNVSSGCAPLIVNFNNASTGNCNEIKSFEWNFGDPTSGVNNTSSNINPSHIFIPGNTTFTVSLMVESCTGAIDTSKKTIITNSVLALTITPTTSLSICNGDSVTVSVNGGTNYTWNPSGGINSSTGSMIIAKPTSFSTYTLTGSNGSGCSAAQVITFSVTNYPLINVSNDTSICYGEHITLTASGGNTYVWNTGTSAASTLVNPTVLTSYIISVYNGACMSTDSIHVNVLQLPFANAGTDTTIKQGETVTLSANGNGTYLWRPSTGLSCITCSNPIATPQVPTEYILIVTNANGCTYSDTMYINVEQNNCKDFFIPNVFSPNNDGQNDYECVMGACVKAAYIIIYDRWGTKIFETTDHIQCWDGKYKGKEMDSGVYLYNANITFISGETINQKGNLTLIR